MEKPPDDCGDVVVLAWNGDLCATIVEIHGKFNIWMLEEVEKYLRENEFYLEEDYPEEMTEIHYHVTWENNSIDSYCWEPFPEEVSRRVVDFHGETTKSLLHGMQGMVMKLHKPL